MMEHQMWANFLGIWTIISMVCFSDHSHERKTHNRRSGTLYVSKIPHERMYILRLSSMICVMRITGFGSTGVTISFFLIHEISMLVNRRSSPPYLSIIIIIMFHFFKKKPTLHIPFLNGKDRNFRSCEFAYKRKNFYDLGNHHNHPPYWSRMHRWILLPQKSRLQARSWDRREGIIWTTLHIDHRGRMPPYRY